MNIYLQGNNAFVDLGKGYLLCIGTRQEVDKADETKLVAMIWRAVVQSQFNAIVVSPSKLN